MAVSTRLGLNLLDQAQSSKEVTLNGWLLPTAGVGLDNAVVLNQANPVNPAIAASAAYGSISVGSGGFAGGATPNFQGNAAGTGIAVNAAAAFTGNLLDLQVGGAARLSVTAAGNLGVGAGSTNPGSTLVVNAGTRNAPGQGILFAITCSPDTNRFAGVEYFDMAVSTGPAAIQWATGTLSLQRFSWFRRNTIAFVGASTVADAATVAIEGAPTAGTNATITNSYALWIQAGGARIQGHLSLGGGTAPTAAAGANAGTSPPAPVVTAGATDTRANVTFGTGTGPAAGAQLVATFAAAYGAAPFVWLTPRNTATQALGLYVSATSTTGFTVSATNAPAASQGNTVYSFDWLVAQ